MIHIGFGIALVTLLMLLGLLVFSIKLSSNGMGSNIGLGIIYMIIFFIWCGCFLGTLATYLICLFT